MTDGKRDLPRCISEGADAGEPGAVRSVARRILGELAEERDNLRKASERTQHAELTLNRLEERLGESGARTPEVADLMSDLKESICSLRRDCVDSWSRSVSRWLGMVERLRNETDTLVGLATLGELSASVAHEIRNPLCGMLLSVEVLQGKMDAEDSRVMVLDNIHREAEKMEKVVSNLLHFAREYKPRVVQCELEEVVEESIDSVQAHLKKKQIQVQVNRPAPGCAASVDPDLVQQVFRNILLNSVEASPRGSELVVDLHRLDDGQRVAVAFRDPGEGIETDQLGRIFEPFFTSKSNGVGLGLSVSKKIVEAHKGGIEVASRPGEGTTFTVTFPARLHAEMGERVPA